MRLTLFPDAGAKILNLVHKGSGFDLLWNNPRVPLRRTYPGAAFDDVWCGGWDELFPTDNPGEVGDNTFHDHGDLWFGPWDWSVAHDDGEVATVYLRRHTVALPCLMERWLTVWRDGVHVEFRYRLTNLGTQPVPFTWNLHVAHRDRAGLPHPPPRPERRRRAGTGWPFCRCARFSGLAHARGHGHGFGGQRRQRADRVAVRERAR